MISRLEHIFAVQTKLAHEFHEIERDNLPIGGDVGLIVNLNTCAGQARIRELTARVCMECAEFERTTPRSTESLDELADVFHFLVELFICIGVDPKTISPHCGNHADHDSLVCSFVVAANTITVRSLDTRYVWAELTDALWHWVNQLKFKPWKRHPKKTDVEAFRSCAKAIFVSFLRICLYLDVDDNALNAAYFRKHQENESRIASKS